jgi:hypothetical protein
MRRALLRTPRSAAAATLALAAVGLAACGHDTGGGDHPAATARGVDVGRVDGSRAYIALVSDGRRLGGYLCDGRTLSVWLEPTRLDDGHAKLRSRRGGALGDVALGASSGRGTVRLGGVAHAFAVSRASGRAGLYRAVAGRAETRGAVEAGWIVIADGSVRGAANRFIDPNSNPIVRPAPALAFGDGSVRAPGASALAVRPVGSGFIDPNTEPAR